MPIIADMKGDIVKNYKVYTTGNMVDHAFLKFKLAIPTTYLIGINGIITWRYVGTREDRPSISQIFQAIEENLNELNKSKKISTNERSTKNSKPLVFYDYLVCSQLSFIKMVQNFFFNTFFFYVEFYNDFR
uniref:Uncharacterized protein n=1 Tax=Promethearchaeum syntrophicum TaxID=2594042 RepID=A0A5B9D7Z6_9ARCH|nr:hypothetical protein DSAG12_01079 [Candidatus Prometheoarchaeum syntrophicum]